MRVLLFNYFLTTFYKSLKRVNKFPLLLLLLLSSQKFMAENISLKDTLYTLAKVEQYRSSNPDSSVIIIDSIWRREKLNGFKNISEIQVYYSYGMACARANQAHRAVRFLLEAHATDSAKASPSFDTHICMAISEQYMFLGESDKALSFALKAYDRAKKDTNIESNAGCLAVIGNVYSQMKMYDKAHLYIDRAVQTSKQIENKILYKYVKGDVLAQERKFEESANLIQQLLNELNGLSPEDIELTYYRNPIELDYFKAELLSLMSYSLIMSNSPTKAKKACDEAIHLIRPIEQVRMPVYLSLFNYMEEAKNWTGLISEIKRILPKIEMGDSVNNYNYILKTFLAQAYAGLGDYQNAYRYKSEAADLNEKLSEKMKINTAIELGTLYETAEKDAQILNQNYVIKNQRNHSIALLVLLILATIIILLIYSNLQRIRLKNKKLFEQIALVSEKEEVLQTLKMTKSDNKLFQDVEELMNTRKLYLNPEICRKDIATELSTNETYLCTAIREATELSFQNYIHKLRLEAARKKLINPKDSDTIEAIALDCGFNSTRNFHRLFREKFGMTPTEFRKLAHSENRVINQ